MFKSMRSYNLLLKIWQLITKETVRILKFQKLYYNKLFGIMCLGALILVLTPNPTPIRQRTIPISKV